MTQIISLPDQGPMIGEMHKVIIESFNKTSRVDYSLRQFIQNISKENDLPEVIVMDHGWMQTYAGALSNPKDLLIHLKDLKNIPVIGIHMSGDVESAHARLRSHFNIVQLVNNEEQWIDTVMMDNPNCGLRDAIQRVFDAQERITDRPITRFDVTGKGQKPTKYAKFIV